MVQTTGGPEGSAALAAGHDLAQARLQVATEAAQLGLWDWDLIDDSLVWDARSRAMYGQSDMPLTGLVSDIDRTIHPEDRPAVAAELARAIEARGNLEIEFRVVHPDGTERIVYARGQALVDASGRAVRMLGTNADVTEVRRAQRQAVQDTERTAALVDVARALGEADDEDAVAAVVDGAARTLLGANGVAFVIATGDQLPPQRVRGRVTFDAPAEVVGLLADLPVDTAVPAVETLLSGRSYFYGDRASGSASFPAGEALWAAAGVQALATVPMTSPDGVFGSFSVTCSGERAWRPADERLVETFASLVAQALRRIWARTAEVTARRSAQRWAAQQGTLVALASSLELAGDVDEVLAVVSGGGVGLLSARGTVLTLREGEVLRAYTTAFFDAQVRSEVADLPGDFPLPMVDAATTGREHFLRDAEEAFALFPAQAATTRELYAQARTRASAAVPLRGRGEVIGSLSVGLDVPHEWTRPEQQLLAAFAALTAQALERIRSREAEEAANAAVRRFSETLQRSLLTSPPEPEGLDVAVRYVPAAAEAQVGGDWYDAFQLSDGATSVVVGDVTGHDREAAAAMAQMRNLLRGIAHSSGAQPAQVLSRLDAAVDDLAVGAMATVLLATVEQPPELLERGQRLLRWSNAGHPPPLLLGPDGSTRFLETEPDLLIGLAPGLPRHDHALVLEPGSTLLVFTDGLVERRASSLTDGLAWLEASVRELAHLAPGALCDELLARVGGGSEDDVALLAVRSAPPELTTPPS